MARSPAGQRFVRKPTRRRQALREPTGRTPETLEPGFRRLRVTMNQALLDWSALIHTVTGIGEYAWLRVLAQTKLSGQCRTHHGYAVLLCEPFHYASSPDDNPESSGGQDVGMTARDCRDRDGQAGTDPSAWGGGTDRKIRLLGVISDG